MASALEEREEQSSKCFVCDMKVTSRSSYDVYCTFMPQREKLLIDVMSKILQKILNPSQMRSSVLCRRCFTLFDELDQISIRFKKLQTDIIKRYTSTCIEYKDDTFISIVNSMARTNMIKLPFGEQDQKNENNSLTNEVNLGDKSSNALNEIVEFIINNIQAEETMDNDKDFGLSISDDLKDKNISICEEVTENINEIIDDPLPDFEKPLSESKVRKRSVGVSYKCEQCDDCFRQATDLQNHCATVHQTSKRFFCSSCDKSYSTKQSLNNHLTKEHTFVDKQINSQIGGPTCSVLKLENDASQNVIESNLEVSADCTNDSSDNVVIDVKPDYSIDNSMYLEEIVQEGNEDDDFEWKEEVKTNYNVANIIEDSSSAFDESVTPSSESEKSDKKSTKKGRKKRGNSRSGERACLPAIHSCEVCGKKWRTVTELKSHIQSHSTIRPYVCEICGQAYKMKKALDVHIGMHNGIHPFTCTYCNKSFTQKVGLQKHIPIHTGYTRFQCDLCGKRFIHQKSFHIHTMTHTGEKHVKCPECGLAVLSQSHLKRHLRVHTGERPYACPICGKRFAEKYNMNAHVHIHDSNAGTANRRNRNHVCQLCGNSYDRKHKLEYHLSSTHNKFNNKLSQDSKTDQQQLELKTEFFQENSQGHQIITVDSSTIEHCDVSFDRKFKVEYHLTSSHNKIESKHSHEQETEPQQTQKFEHEYFQENSQGHQIITVDNSAIEHNGSTAMITVSGVKVPISLDGAPIMVTTLPQQSQNANLLPVPLNLPAGSILTYTSPSSNDNEQPMVDGTQNAYLSQNPVTIQLS